MAKRISTPARPSQIKPTNLVRFHLALAKWYQTHGRHDLPWRNTTDPYHIWLSEVMLQQTQVSTVRDRFYGPFLKKFPTIAALAAAPSESVMKAWEGLGYYSRARNLHKAAQQLNSEGGLPPFATSSLSLPLRGSASPTHDLLQRLLGLPGIGCNTASAILAFAYHQPVAILEANVKRIIARVFALTQPNDAELWAGAEALLNHTHPFDYNQAMMDIGALICTPKNPRCDACPANMICQGKASPQRYPTPKAKKQTPTREVIIHVREDARGRLFLEKRDEKLLGGLYGFPQTALSTSGSSQMSKGSRAKRNSLGTVTHVYSHFKLIGYVVRETVTAKPNSPDWHTRTEISQLPLSKLDHKVLALVENCHSAKKKRTKA
jgi:A/G-specific adenine glycosylase